MVPEAYRQSFWSSIKEEKQTYVEFVYIKERFLINGVHLRALMRNTQTARIAFANGFQELPPTRGENLPG